MYKRFIYKYVFVFSPWPPHVSSFWFFAGYFFSNVRVILAELGGRQGKCRFVLAQMACQIIQTLYWICTLEGNSVIDSRNSLRQKSQLLLGLQVRNGRLIHISRARGTGSNNKRRTAGSRGSIDIDGLDKADENVRARDGGVVVL